MPNEHSANDPHAIRTDTPEYAAWDRVTTATGLFTLAELSQEVHRDDADEDVKAERMSTLLETMPEGKLIALTHAIAKLVHRNELEHLFDSVKLVLTVRIAKGHDFSDHTAPGSKAFMQNRQQTILERVAATKAGLVLP